MNWPLKKLDQKRYGPFRISKNIGLGVFLLETQVLRVGQVNEPCIGLIQENSMENSVQDSLPYILNLHGLC